MSKRRKKPDVAELCRVTGLSKQAICQRIRAGWPESELAAPRRTGPQPSKFLTHDGQTLTLREWGERLGLPYATLYQRMRKGYSTDQILATRKWAREIMRVQPAQWIKLDVESARKLDAFAAQAGCSPVEWVMRAIDTAPSRSNRAGAAELATPNREPRAGRRIVSATTLAAAAALRAARILLLLHTAGPRGILLRDLLEQSGATRATLYRELDRIRSAGWLIVVQHGARNQATYSLDPWQRAPSIAVLKRRATVAAKNRRPNHASNSQR